MDKQVVIYSNPRTNQKREQAFLEEVLKYYPTAKLVSQTYIIHQNIIDSHLIDIHYIIERVATDVFLTKGNREHILKKLTTLPRFIKIATTNNYVTVDIAIKTSNQIKYIEFHEKQHRGLSIKNRQNYFIFSNENISIEVPRSIQRFLRDIWRTQYLDNFSIVWWDWFEVNRSMIPYVLSNDNMEHHLSDKFSFSKLLNKAS